MLKVILVGDVYTIATWSGAELAFQEAMLDTESAATITIHLGPVGRITAKDKGIYPVIQHAELGDLDRDNIDGLDDLI